MKLIKYNILIIFSTLVMGHLAFAQLSNVKIGVDAGHGGKDPGALGINGSATPDEADIVLTVSKEIQKKFQNLGATVVMTRTTDVFQELSFRRNLMNEQNPDAYVSVHENSFGVSSANGTETLINTSAGDNSFNLATKIQNKLLEDMGFRDRGVKRQGLGAVRVKASIPAALTEGCFLSNPTEWNYITQLDNQICHANSIKNGILDYLNYDNLIDLNCDGDDNNPPPNNPGNVAPLGSLYDVSTELSSSFGAANAFDGTTDTRWNSDGAADLNYLVLQLDTYYTINRLVLKHGSSAGLSTNLNTEKYRIYYWQNSDWNLAVNHTNSTKSGTTSHDVTIEDVKWIGLVIDDPTFTSDKYARIPEFEVYGDPLNINRLSNQNEEGPAILNFETGNKKLNRAGSKAY